MFRADKQCMSDELTSCQRKKPRIGKNLAPYRIGKRPHQQNRAKIHQKYRKSYFFVFLTYFCPILRVAMFSYPVGGQVFPKPRTTLQKQCVFTETWAVGPLLEPDWFLFRPDALLPSLGFGSQEFEQGMCNLACSSPSRWHSCWWPLWTSASTSCSLNPC